MESQHNARLICLIRIRKINKGAAQYRAPIEDIRLALGREPSWVDDDHKPEANQGYDITVPLPISKLKGRGLRQGIKFVNPRMRVVPLAQYPVRAKSAERHGVPQYHACGVRISEKADIGHVKHLTDGTAPKNRKNEGAQQIAIYVWYLKLWARKFHCGQSIDELERGFVIFSTEKLIASVTKDFVVRDTMWNAPSEPKLGNGSVSDTRTRLYPPWKCLRHEVRIDEIGAGAAEAVTVGWHVRSIEQWSTGTVWDTRGAQVWGCRGKVCA
jgi:hypothetical protein